MKEKELTIYDLAARLNLSAATVSRGLQNHPAISKLTRQRINDLAMEVGYRSNRMASSLRTQQTNTIGVIVPRLNSNFMSTALAGIEDVLHGQGYNLIISQSLESYEKEVSNAKTMFNNRVDGLLVSLAYNTNNTDHFEPFLSKKIPVLFFDRVALDSNGTNISIDNLSAAYNITSHLITQGCKKIMFLTAPSHLKVYADRLAGYQKALIENDIQSNAKMVMHVSLDYPGGLLAGEQILKMKNKPDAIFAANDFCAVGCMQVLLKAGYSIPEEIAFAGFNNDPVSLVIQPNLTTVDYRGHHMGEIAAHHLLEAISGTTVQQSPSHIVLDADLIIRQSSLRTDINHQA